VLNVPVLYGVLDGKRQAEGLSWNRLAAQLDVGSSAFSRMARGRAPDSHTLGTLLMWLGWAPELALIVQETTPAGDGAS
jgi:transcriptional regulator with XRE-family HTH domain